MSTRRTSGFLIGAALAILLFASAGGAAYWFFGSDRAAAKAESPARLAAEARKALEAVKKRDLSSTLRPARYDAILRPLDKMIERARDLSRSPNYHPVNGYDAIRSYTEPVIEIAPLAHAQAQTETGFLKKDYRFLEQKGEACQYLAAALWNRLEATQAPSQERDGVGFQPSPADSRRLTAILDDGIHADPNNKQLWYLRAAVERVNGMFPAAEKDLQKALQLDGDFVAAWNDIGLVYINLKQFEQAERAFNKAKDKAAEAANRAGVAPGDDYVAAVMNLAQFHDALASYYERAVRAEPNNAENKSELARHLDAARSALREVVAAQPPDSPLSRQARDMLNALPN